MKAWKQRLLRYPDIVLSCHESRKGDNLGLLDLSMVQENSIFFLETSCLGDLSSRLACSVESAARANRNRKIYVLFSSPVSAGALNPRAILNTLQESYSNLKFARILIKDFAKNTSLHSFINKLDKRDLDQRVSRILKFLVLYKFGGMYLSFDVIVAKKFDLCDSWFVKDTPYTYSADMFAFSKSEAGKKLAEAAVNTQWVFSRLLEDPLMSTPENWSYDTTSIISHLVALNTFGINATLCKELGFQVYEPDKFYPLNFYQRAAYFSLGEQNIAKKKNVYTYHTFYRFTKHIIVSPLSFYGKIARNYCPITFRHYRENFGV
ncbi:lactosylceramide 4-alpha-galactosyltransferase-like [Spodoptera litura]|uniref:Lactosylceramide 4-alpha-galactosyltransferase-like n=1 Tax=Spodoptera litura TaxID=69820 RepID=A0A9J7ESR1_SPOLT|nr:lactosylceramide 4-alpha-galactosyltransferase-like [Spodoptera litura]